ncbi:uncharacterized protein PAC_12019 [Phialocephala subalpina]|uniref:F-box domain-containing protein n=1 Tax=Phialocephala subalpina TaxID=576137 RepID=A0A1L7XAS5_9HELO|nr:uncharacterized protein PAC_12019 [Phialocephala subalpina]
MDTYMVDGDNAQSPLTSIPLEVLLQVTSHLTTPEYGSLRRTCKAIEASLFNAFSREFFTKRQFMLTEFSLQALVDISKSRLSTSMKHVILGLERPYSNSFSHITRPSGNQTDPDLQQNGLLQEYVGHMVLISTGQDVEMLAEAFSNLGNLDRIEIRDFYSRTRRRDYPNIEWKSYGVSTFEQITGSQLERPRRTHIFGSRSDELPERLSRIFLNTLRALGKADARPKHFEVILRETSLHDHAFIIPKYTEHLVQPVLANLRTLFLDINCDSPVVRVEADNQPRQCPSYLLRIFLSKVTDLEYLRLNFHSYPRDSSNDFLLWLAMQVPTPTPNGPSRTLYPNAPLPVEFHNLQQLDIGMTAINPELMVEIVRKYRATLRSISFHKVSLWQTEPVQRGEKVDLWGEFFAKLSKLYLNLSRVNMSFLSQVLLGPERIQQIQFEGSRVPAIRKWAGTDIQSGLRDFISEIKVDRSGDVDSENSESDDSDSELSDSFPPRNPSRFFPRGISRARARNPVV